MHEKAIHCGANFCLYKRYVLKKKITTYILTETAVADCKSTAISLIKYKDAPIMIPTIAAYTPSNDL